MISQVFLSIDEFFDVINLHKNEMQSLQSEFHCLLLKEDRIEVMNK
jgi:hypothetical protein